MTPLTSQTARMELLRIERLAGNPPYQSALDHFEFLHLYAMLSQLRTPTPEVAEENRQTHSKLLGRGFDHQYATRLITLARGGLQPLTMLVREAAVRPELKFRTAA